MKTFLSVCLPALLGILINAPAAAQSLRYSLSMPYLGLSAYSVKQHDPFSFTGNQAALARASCAGIGVYGEQRFLIENNNAYCVAAEFPSTKGNFGAVLDYSGFPNFAEMQAGLAYGRSLGSKVDVGVQFDYYSYNIPTYYSASAIYFEGGAVFHLTQKVNAGIEIYAPAGGKLSKTKDEKIASAYKFGLGYDASEAFYFSAEMVKEQAKPLDVTGGIQYRFRKQFFVKGGFRSDNNIVYGGAGFLYRNLRIDVAASVHPQLGITPGVLLIYQFKKS